MANEIKNPKIVNLPLLSHFKEKIDELLDKKANKTDIATTEELGLIKPDNSTVFVDENGVLSSVGGSGGTGTSALSDLTDVELTSLTDGQGLFYDETLQKWVNKNVVSSSAGGILYGTDVPSDDMGSDGNLYYQYTDTEVVNEDYTDSGFGWQAKKEYVKTEAGTVCTVSGRSYYKLDDGAVVVVAYTDGANWSAPAFISTDINLARFGTSHDDVIQEGTTAFEYNGQTWYICAGGYAMSGTNVSGDAVYIGNVDISDSNSDENKEILGKYVLDLAGVTSSGKTLITKFEHSYLKIHGTWLCVS